MQKRIEQLAEGRFEYDRPVLSFSEDKIEIEILEGKDYTGEFVITSANRVPMRGRMAEGRFEYDRPVLSFSEDKIEIEILEGKDYTGEFVITSANRVPMRGRIETSSERMECLTPQFAGEEAHIHYQFHSSGFVEGDIQKGEFYIICAGGEYNLSFVVENITSLLLCLSAAYMPRPPSDASAI